MGLDLVFCKKFDQKADEFLQFIQNIDKPLENLIRKIENEVYKLNNATLSTAAQITTKAQEALQNVDIEIAPILDTGADIDNALQQCLGMGFSDFLGNSFGNIFDDIRSTIFGIEENAQEVSNLIYDTINDAFSTALGVMTDLVEYPLCLLVREMRKFLEDIGFFDYLDEIDKVLNCMTSICPTLDTKITYVINEINIFTEKYSIENATLNIQSLLSKMDASQELIDNVISIDQSIGDIEETTSNNIFDTLSESLIQI